MVLNCPPSEEADAKEVARLVEAAGCRALAEQVASSGIRVNAVAPGPVWTPRQPSGGQPRKKIPDFGAQAPLGRPGQPAELAPVHVLLASQEPSFVTGEVYGVTGGNHLP